MIGTRPTGGKGILGLARSVVDGLRIGAWSNWGKGGLVLGLCVVIGLMKGARPNVV